MPCGDGDNGLGMYDALQESEGGEWRLPPDDGRGVCEAECVGE